MTALAEPAAVQYVAQSAVVAVVDPMAIQLHQVSAFVAAVEFAVVAIAVAVAD